MPTWYSLSLKFTILLTRMKEGACNISSLFYHTKKKTFLLSFAQAPPSSAEGGDLVKRKRKISSKKKPPARDVCTKGTYYKGGGVRGY